MRYTALCFLVPLCCLVGCGTRTTVHPVAGRVLVDGRPATFAKVVFHPILGSKTLAVAAADAAGRFRLMTYSFQDGAAAGEYAVTVIWFGDDDVDECADPLTCDRLKGRYSDSSTTPLRATVQPGRNEVELRTRMVVGNWALPRLRDLDRK